MRLSIATREAVNFACRNFYYSGSMPIVKYAFNVFNDSGEWCGVIVYGSGANNHIASPYDLWQGEVLELVRVHHKWGENSSENVLFARMGAVSPVDP